MKFTNWFPDTELSSPIGFPGAQWRSLTWFLAQYKISGKRHPKISFILQKEWVFAAWISVPEWSRMAQNEVPRWWWVHGTEWNSPTSSQAQNENSPMGSLVQNEIPRLIPMHRMKVPQRVPLVQNEILWFVCILDLESRHRKKFPTWNPCTEWNFQPGFQGLNGIFCIDSRCRMIKFLECMKKRNCLCMPQS